MSFDVEVGAFDCCIALINKCLQKLACSFESVRPRAVRPDTAAIVLVNRDDLGEEILARSIGVSVVLTEDYSDELLLATVAAVLGIEIPAVVSVEETNRHGGAVIER